RRGGVPACDHAEFPAPKRFLAGGARRRLILTVFLRIDWTPSATAVSPGAQREAIPSHTRMTKGSAMRQFALSCVLAASLAVPAWAGDVTIATAQGEVTLPAAPAKVAVFDIAAIDSLNALGVRAAGVPDNTYMSFLQDATSE